MERIRVALQNRFAARVGDGQLIHGVRLERLVRVALPDRVVDLCQRVPVRVPTAEIAGDRNRLRIRRPDTADGACFAVPHRVVHPHVLVGVAVLTRSGTNRAAHFPPALLQDSFRSFLKSSFPFEVRQGAKTHKNRLPPRCAAALPPSYFPAENPFLCILRHNPHAEHNLRIALCTYNTTTRKKCKGF